MEQKIMTDIAMARSGSTGAAARHRMRERDKGALAVVERACRYIESRRDIGEGVVTLADLGAHCRMSPWHLQRLFKQVMGVSPRQYADAHRVRRLKDGLQQGESVAGAT